MADYYLEDKKRLEGQPKRTIADYVEQQGFLVPRRFYSLEEAIASKKDILLRSEHPQDYDGISDLLESFGINDRFSLGDKFPSNITFTPKDKKTLEEIKKAWFEYQESLSGPAKFQQYCRYQELDEQNFKKELSFSIWEKIPGFNRIIVADTAIPKRYHVMTTNPVRHFRNYAVVDQGIIIRQFVNPLPDALREELSVLLQNYEEIRNLDRFNPNHCPMMEFQTNSGKNYFLQYHRTRDFYPAKFTLQGEPEEGEVEVPFVRGATARTGMECKVTLFYADAISGDFNPEDEDGSYDLHWHHIWSEIQVRKRKVQMFHTDNVEYLIEGTIINHRERSKLFKPQVSIIHNINDVLRDYKKYKNRKNTYLYLHITSDGHRAFVRLADIN